MKLKRKIFITIFGMINRNLTTAITLKTVNYMMQQTKRSSVSLRMRLAEFLSLSSLDLDQKCTLISKTMQKPARQLEE